MYVVFMLDRTCPTGKDYQPRADNEDDANHHYGNDDPNVPTHTVEYNYIPVVMVIRATMVFWKVISIYTSLKIYSILQEEVF